MDSKSSRRKFLAAGLALPVAGAASTTTLTPALRPPEPAPAQSGGLTYRTLGKTGLKLTTISFGCMITSDPSVIAKALDSGINYFDTARVYQNGNNERMVGAVLKNKRKDIHISSKTMGRTKAAALADLDTSLKELGTDYLDIWYLHGKSKPEDILDELIDAQQTAKKAGKIRFAGISNHQGHRELIPAIIKKGAFDVLMTSYNFTMGTSIDDLLDQAHKAGLGVVAMKVMAGGYRVMPFYPTTESTRNLLKREGALLAALKWSIRTPSVHVAIPSMVDMDQFDENLAAMRSPFSEKDGKLLAAQLQYIGSKYCRMCNQCEGTCSQGLPVPDMLRILTYADGYGQFALARERFQELPVRATASTCGQCPSCSVQCPNGVNVAARLSQAQEWFA